MTEIERTFERLAPTLRRVSHKLVDPTGYLEPDDLFQEMAIVFLERAWKDPTFIQQKDAYMIVACTHNGGTHQTRRQRIYRKYVGTEETLVPDNRELSFDEVTPSLDRSVEEQVEDHETILALAVAVRELSPRDQTIVKMLYLGDRQVEISRALGESAANINYRKQVIAGRLAGAL